MNRERLTTLAAFIRSQANLTDSRPHVPGPGRVELNNAEALEVADGLDTLLRSSMCVECGATRLEP